MSPFDTPSATLTTQSLLPAERARSLAWSTRALLAVVSGLMMYAPWVNPMLFWTGWLAGVPLLYALRDSRLPTAFLLGWLAGVLCFAGASHWMIDFMIHLKGLSWLVSAFLASLFWLYTGLAVGFACLLYRWCSLRLPRWDLLSFPLVVVVVMAVFPQLFVTDFAEGQVRFLVALQGVDLIGAQGLNFIMLLFSVLLFQLLQAQHAQDRAAALGMSAAAAVILLWFAYGFYALAYWDSQVRNWETRRIGLVQPNDAPTRRIPAPREGFTRESPEEMVASRRLAKAGAQWVAWPEARYKGYYDMFTVRQGYAKEVGNWGVPLFFHDVENRWISAEKVSFNTVAWLDGEGQLVGQYRKVKRMPFGEYLPEFFQLPGVGQITRLFMGDYLRPVGAGSEHQVFSVGDMRVIPKVCYETAFPQFVAQSIGQDAGGKLLLFLSQDNWFGETSQPFQHRDMSIVRGVENRVPMVHLINNGPSVATAPSGRVVASTQAFSRAERLVDMPFDAQAGGSFYSRHAVEVQRGLYAALGVLLLAGLLSGRGKRRQCSG
ncbi:apolipoprotein N-acyltransferase [Halopseudomonas sabulinigri]|uniref:Apolipoprotein N-acyltransferase n=1 Tax=Halopseudomonas sabulinigri TaxID=472181 RepID=A0A1H1S2R1_9GAMM|nr:apolipoprotein N-acyltransferase [Halopseudomonas sabulinigri]SDS42088.1 apolipoprotein N-acyltransferase [Halopseudomonas sabulinigri]